MMVGQRSRLRGRNSCVKTDNLEINSVLIDRNDSEDRIKRREEEKRGNADGRRMAVEMGIGLGSVFAGQITSA